MFLKIISTKNNNERHVAIEQLNEYQRMSLDNLLEITYCNSDSVNFTKPHSVRWRVLSSVHFVCLGF